jgi:hypothetical protein
MKKKKINFENPKLFQIIKNIFDQRKNLKLNITNLVLLLSITINTNKEFLIGNLAILILKYKNTNVNVVDNEISILNEIDLFGIIHDFKKINDYVVHLKHFDFFLVEKILFCFPCIFLNHHDFNVYFLNLFIYLNNYIVHGQIEKKSNESEPINQKNIEVFLFYSIFFLDNILKIDDISNLVLISKTENKYQNLEKLLFYFIYLSINLNDLLQNHDYQSTFIINIIYHTKHSIERIESLFDYCVESRENLDALFSLVDTIYTFYKYFQIVITEFKQNEKKFKTQRSRVDILKNMVLNEKLKEKLLHLEKYLKYEINKDIDIDYENKNFELKISKILDKNLSKFLMDDAFDHLFPFELNNDTINFFQLFHGVNFDKYSIYDSNILIDDFTFNESSLKSDDESNIINNDDEDFVMESF